MAAHAGTEHVLVTGLDGEEQQQLVGLLRKLLSSLEAAVSD